MPGYQELIITHPDNRSITPYERISFLYILHLMNLAHGTLYKLYAHFDLIDLMAAGLASM